MISLWPCRVFYHRCYSAVSIALGDTPLNFYKIMYDFCWSFFGRQKIVASYNVFIMINLFIIDCLTSIPTSEALPVDLYTKQR